jgi:hypothetical protein
MRVRQASKADPSAEAGAQCVAVWSVWRIGQWNTACFSDRCCAMWPHDPAERSSIDQGPGTPWWSEA